MSNPTDMTIASAVNNFLRTGDCDPYDGPWAGGVIERERTANETCRRALIDRVLDRTRGSVAEDEIEGLDVRALVRGRVAPMVRGLFPPHEREAVLHLAERSVVFVSSKTIRELLWRAPFPSTAWDIANLYLASAGAPLLSADALRIVGLNAGRTCYVSAEYLRARGKFDDFVVHEASHMFHNCKRRDAGLRHTARREWLLDIAFASRETFAYACEAYARVLEQSTSRAQRIALLDRYASTLNADDERGAIVREASEARNGWKVILRRCSDRRQESPE